jgi:assimilatory nitrate reductase catalytic subunit
VHQGLDAAPDASGAVTRQARLLQPMQRACAARRPSAVVGHGAGPRGRQASPNGHRAHGPDSVGFYISGQLLTEDYYVFNKLAKGLVGTNNIDTNSRCA